MRKHFDKVKQLSERVIELGDKILKAWRGYTDEAAFVFAETDGEPHNTITPIARKRSEFGKELLRPVGMLFDGCLTADILSLYNIGCQKPKLFTVSGFEDVNAGIVKWPMSVIRLRSGESERVIELGDKILKAWRGYTDEAHRSLCHGKFIASALEMIMG